MKSIVLPSSSVLALRLGTPIICIIITFALQFQDLVGGNCVCIPIQNSYLTLSSNGINWAIEKTSNKRKCSDPHGLLHYSEGRIDINWFYSHVISSGQIYSVGYSNWQRKCRYSCMYKNESSGFDSRKRDVFASLNIIGLLRDCLWVLK